MSKMVWSVRDIPKVMGNKVVSKDFLYLMDFFKLNLFSLFTVHFTPVVTYFDENRPQFFGAAGRNWTEILAGRQPTGGLARASICWRVKNHITRPYSSLSTLPNIVRFIHITHIKLQVKNVVGLLYGSKWFAWCFQEIFPKSTISRSY